MKMKMFFKKFLIGVGLLCIFHIIATFISALFGSWGLSIDSIFLTYFICGQISGYNLYNLLKEDK